MVEIVTIVLVVFFCFAVVIPFGAPYLPTLKPQVDTSLDLLDLKPGQTLLELGCGDGKVVLAAAKKGLNVVGFELNPLLASFCYIRTVRYRKQVRIIWGDYWRADWPPADGIFVFLLPRYMEKLNKKVIQHKCKPVKLISYAFPILSVKAVKEKDGVYYYRYL